MTEISFDKCINPKTSHKLFFDYGIYKDDELCLIEVDGEYHYKDVVGRNELLFQQQRDKIKEENSTTIRCIPFEEDKFQDVCSICGKKAKHMVYAARQY